MKITPQIIAACKKAGACKEGLAYISVKGRTIEQLYEFDREWFFWLKRILSDEAHDAYYAAVRPALYAYYQFLLTIPFENRLALDRDAYYAVCDDAVQPARDAFCAVAKIALIDALRKTFA